MFISIVYEKEEYFPISFLTPIEGFSETQIKIKGLRKYFMSTQRAIRSRYDRSEEHF